MRSILEFIIRFIGLDAQNMIPEVPLFMAVLWFVVLVCTFASIYSQPMDAKGKVVWGLFALLVPLVGVAVYAIYCLVMQDNSFMKIFFGNKAPKATFPSAPRLPDRANDAKA